MCKKLSLILALVLASILNSFGQDSMDPLDEFEAFSPDSVVTTLAAPTPSGIQHKAGAKEIYWTAAVLFFTVAAGISVRHASARQLRSLFLVLSIAVLGFYRGGCPCSIQSFQNAFLWLFGSTIAWHSLLLIGGLIVLTFLFGRVYCGWICQLGALQEFIFKTSSFKVFQSERAQRIMRGIRIVVFLALIIQLLLTQTNLYKRIDPFSAIYNFYSPHITGWVLVFILVGSSFFMYRPFCKTVCPVGLLLGWLSKIPGASVLGVKNTCIGCVVCNRKCSINAITHDSKISALDNQECIRCGECLSGCKKDALHFYRKGRQHPFKIECKPLFPATA
jgi:polyferredoxin